MANPSHSPIINRLLQTREQLLSDNRNVVARVEASHFAPYIGQPFVIDVNGWGKVGAVLINVQERRASQVHPAARVPFSLIFRGPHEPQLQQDTFKVIHDNFGTMDLFLVPLGVDEFGAAYQATFN